MCVYAFCWFFVDENESVLILRRFTFAIFFLLLIIFSCCLRCCCCLERLRLADFCTSFMVARDNCCTYEHITVVSGTFFLLLLLLLCLIACYKYSLICAVVAAASFHNIVSNLLLPIFFLLLQRHVMLYIYKNKHTHSRAYMCMRMCVCSAHLFSSSRLLKAEQISYFATFLRCAFLVCVFSSFLLS